jgi:hypothetical protein
MVLEVFLQTPKKLKNLVRLTIISLIRKNKRLRNGN